jgi:hypothetical protein
MEESEAALVNQLVTVRVCLGGVTDWETLESPAALRENSRLSLVPIDTLLQSGFKAARKSYST